MWFNTEGGREFQFSISEATYSKHEHKKITYAEILLATTVET